MLSAPLALVYNQLLSVSYMPPKWLVAHIVPVHKKGIISDVANYRPISLTYVASKILERIVVNRILDHLIHTLHNMVLASVVLPVPTCWKVSMIGLHVFNP